MKVALLAYSALTTLILVGRKICFFPDFSACSGKAFVIDPKSPFIRLKSC